MIQRILARFRQRAHADAGTHRNLLLAGLICLIAFHVCANLWWLHVDNHAIRADEARHLLSARTHYEILQNTKKSLKCGVRGACLASRTFLPADPLAGALMVRFVAERTRTSRPTLLMVLAHRHYRRHLVSRRARLSGADDRPLATW